MAAGRNNPLVFDLVVVFPPTHSSAVAFIFQDISAIDFFVKFDFVVDSFTDRVP